MLGIAGCSRCRELTLFFSMVGGGYVQVGAMQVGSRGQVEAFHLQSEM